DDGRDRHRMARRFPGDRRICPGGPGCPRPTTPASSCWCWCRNSSAAPENDPPEIESSRCLLLAQRSISLLVPIALQAGGWSEQAEAVCASASTFAHMQNPLREAAEYARPNPLVSGVINRALKVIAAADEKSSSRALLHVRAGELAVSVI